MIITSPDHETKVTATSNALKQKGCVLFVGAGISINPPAGLPNWHDLRDWTLEAVASQSTNLQSLLPKLTELDMIGSPGRKGMTPELVASVISGVCPGYFDSLNVLDEGSPNENHLSIALLAKLGLVRYIVTTNFDLFIEKALEQQQVEFAVYRTDEEFARFPLGLDFIPQHVCLFKIHGCLSQPSSIIATVEKQAVGLSGQQLLLLKWLQRKYTFVFWGYSGWDLKIHLDYLGTVSVADVSPGFIWSLHRAAGYEEAPSPYILELAYLYEKKAIVGHTLAPAAIAQIFTSSGVSLPNPVTYTPEEHANWVATKNNKLSAELKSWAAREVRQEMAVKIFGNLLDIAGFREDARACFTELVEKAHKTSNAYLLGAGLLLLGHSYEKIGILPRALDYYQQAEEIARSIDDMDMLASALEGESIVLVKLGFPQQALVRCQDARRFHNVGGDPFSAARIAESVGSIFDSQRRYEDALRFYSQAEQGFRRGGAKHALCGCLNKLGIIYRNWGDFDNAIRYFRESLLIAKEIIGDRHSVEAARLFLASVNVVRGDENSAYDDLLTVESYAREAHIPNLLAMATQYLVLVEHNRGNIERVKDLQAELIGIYREQNNRRELGIALLNSVSIQLLHGNVGHALSSCEEAVKLLRDVGDTLGVALALDKTGEIFQDHLSQPAKAAQYFSQSISAHLNVDQNPRQFIPPLLRRIATCKNRERRPPTDVIDEILVREPLLVDGLRAVYGEHSSTEWHEQIKSSKANEEDVEGPLYSLAMHMQQLGQESQADKRKSLRYLRAALALAETIDYQQLIASISSDVGWQHILLEEFEAGIPRLQQAVQMSHALDDVESEILHTGNLGFALVRSGEEEAGFATLDRALQLARQTHNGERLLWLLRDVGEHYKEQRDARALPFLMEAIPLAEQAGDLKLLSELHFDAGKVCYDTEDFEQSLQHRAHAIKLLEATTQDLMEMVSRLTVVANLCETKLGRLVPAIDYYDQALAYCYRAHNAQAIKEIMPLRLRAVNKLTNPSDLPYHLYEELLHYYGDEKMVNTVLAAEAQEVGFPQSSFEPKSFSRILNSGLSTKRAFGQLVATFAVYLQKIGKYDLADTEFKVAEITALESGDKQWLASVRRQRADLLAASGQYDDAMEAYRDTEIIAQLAENNLEVELVSYAMADIELRRNNVEEALRHIQNALASAKSAGYQTGIAHDLAKMAEILEKKGVIESAVEALKEAIPIFRESKLVSQLVGASLNIGRLMNQLGQHQDAIKTLDEVESLVQSGGTQQARDIFRAEKDRAKSLLRR